MLSSYTLKTGKEGCYDITFAVREAIVKSGVEDGLCLVYCPHTTAGLTINENADPDVVKDLLLGLDKAFPDRTEFRHSEGNSAAHIKASCLGSSVTIIVEKGTPKLGTWQGVYFCEFDGPRERKYHFPASIALFFTTKNPRPEGRTGVRVRAKRFKGPAQLAF